MMQSGRGGNKKKDQKKTREREKMDKVCMRETTETPLERLLSFFPLVLHLSDLLLSDLALLGLLGPVTTLKDGATILVELQLGDLNVARVDADLNGGTVGLLAGDLVDVDDPLLAVDSDDLAVTALGGATHDNNLIILTDGHAAHVVLLTKLLRERGAHHDATLARGSIEVCTTSNTTRRRNVCENKNKQNKKGDFTEQR